MSERRANMNEQSKLCFVLVPECPPTYKECERTRNIRQAIMEAASTCGYTPVASDDMTSLGSRSEWFMRCLEDYPLVIAHLSDADPSVYYGLAARHAFGKPAIQVIDVHEKAGWIVQPLATVAINPYNQIEGIKALKPMIAGIDPSEDALGTPIGAHVINRLFKKLGRDRDKVIATFFEAAKNELTTSLGELKRLTAEIEDATRKPVHGIEQVLVEAHDMLVHKARDGGQVWYVGMTLGLGPPHRYRVRGEQRTGTLLGEIVAAQVANGGVELEIDEEFKRRWPGRQLQIDKLIEVFHTRLTELLQAAPRAVVVCLPHDDGYTLEKNFLTPLASRANYARLKGEDLIQALAAEMRGMHKKVEHYVKGGVGYLDSIPLQMLIVEKKENLGHSKKACLVFHVGTDNLDTPQQDNGEVGFYSEVDSIVEVFQTTAESLREAARRRAAPVTVEVRNA